MSDVNSTKGQNAPGLPLHVGLCDMPQTVLHQSLHKPITIDHVLSEVHLAASEKYLHCEFI